MLARYYFSDQDYVRAIQYYDEAIRCYPQESHQCIVSKGDALKALGRDSEAQDSWRLAEERALELPDSYAKFDALVEISRRRHDDSRAYECLQKALKYCVGNDALHITNTLNALSLSATLLGMPKAGKDWADDSLKHQPKLTTLFNAYNCRGLASLMLGNLDDAMRSYHAAEQSAKSFGNTKLVHRAQIHQINVETAMGHVDAALQKALVLWKTTTQRSAASAAGHCYVWLGRDEEALTALRDAIDRQIDRVWSSNPRKLR